MRDMRVRTEAVTSNGLGSKLSGDRGCQKPDQQSLKKQFPLKKVLTHAFCYIAASHFGNVLGNQMISQKNNRRNSHDDEGYQ